MSGHKNLWYKVAIPSRHQTYLFRSVATKQVRRGAANPPGPGNRAKPRPENPIWHRPFGPDKLAGLFAPSRSVTVRDLSEGMGVSCPCPQQGHGRALTGHRAAFEGARCLPAGPAQRGAGPAICFSGRMPRTAWRPATWVHAETRGLRGCPGSDDISDDDATRLSEFRAATRRTGGCRRTRTGDLSTWPNVC